MRFVKQILCSAPMTVLAISGVSLLVVWPTLAEQHWGLLDDGVTLAVARELQRTWHIPASEAGRFFPAYFVYYALEYRFFGTEIGGYYVVQALLLIFTTLLLYAIVHTLTGSMGLGWLGVFLFLTSSTIPENYYTVSKQEPRLLFFLLSSLYCYIRADLAAQRSHAQMITHRLPCRGALMWGVASAVSLMIAYLTKETTLIVLPAAFLWVLGACWLEKGEARRPRTHAALGYLGINLVTGILFVLAAYVYTPTPLPWVGSYTGLGLSLTPSVETLLYYLKVNFDVLLLVGLALVGMLCWSMLQPPVPSVLAAYTLFCLLCAGLYLVLFIFVWKLTLAYYLLPAAGWAVIASSLLLKMLTADRPVSLTRASVLGVLIVGLVCSRVYAIPAFYNAAVALNAWHTVNGRMLAWAATLSENSRLLFINVPSEHEYIFEARLLLRLLYSREDILVAGASDVEDAVRQARPSDFVVMNFGAEANRQVWVRAVQAIPPLEFSRQALLSATPSLGLEEAFHVESRRTILVPFSVRLRSFVLGWAGYRVAVHPE
ncbi:MAG: hypothetical protein ACRERE_35745 [Candidatus Entotheonellia bacterium]